MTLTRGIDVSHHQGSIDWPALTAAHGLGWGAAKATEGMTFTDSMFTANWSAMKAAGLTRIAYHYGHPALDATAQTRRLVDAARPGKGDVLCLDLEEGDGRTQGQVNAWAKTFGDALRDLAPGTTTVLYAGSGYTTTGTGAGLSAHFDYWWYPRYATMQPVTTWPTIMRLTSGGTTGWDRPHLWQWAASLRTSQGLVDASVSTVTATQLAAGPKRPAPSPPPTPEIALPQEEPMIVIRAEKRLWYLQVGGKLVYLESGSSVPPATILPRISVSERQWARFVAAGAVA